MCKLLSDILLLAHAKNLASQISHVYFSAIIIYSFRNFSLDIYSLAIFFIYNYTLSKKPFIWVFLRRQYFSDSVFCSWRWLDITLVHLSPPLTPRCISIQYHAHTHKISHLATPQPHKISHLAILPILIITNNTMPYRKPTSQTMPTTKKAPRKETGQPPKKSYVASLAAAAKSDPAVTVPSPPQRKGQTTRQLPPLPHAISDMQVVRQIQRQLGWEQLLLYLPKK